MHRGFLNQEPRAKARAKAAAASSEGAQHGLPGAATAASSNHADWSVADSTWMGDFLLAVAHQPDAFQVEQVSPCFVLWSQSTWCGGLFLPPKPGQLASRQQR